MRWVSLFVLSWPREAEESGLQLILVRWGIRFLGDLLDCVSFAKLNHHVVGLKETSNKKFCSFMIAYTYECTSSSKWGVKSSKFTCTSRFTAKHSNLFHKRLAQRLKPIAKVSHNTLCFSIFFFITMLSNCRPKEIFHKVKKGALSILGL